MYAGSLRICEQDNQQERLEYMSLQISDEYLRGFIEGEGMFYVSIVPAKETKTGWQVIYFFKVSQNPQGKMVLDYLQKRLDCGYVKLNHKKDYFSDKSLAFVVRDLKSLQTKVLPFVKDKLIIKRKACEQFEQVLNLVSVKKHLTRAGIEQIIDISLAMNTGKRKFSKNEIVKSYTLESSQAIRQISI